MNNPIFDRPNRDFVESRSPQEGMRLMFQYLIEVATITRDNKATERESKDALTHDIMALQRDYLVINEHPLGDDAYKAIWSLLGRAFEIGQFSGMIDKRAEGPAKSIRQWGRQRESIKAQRYTSWKRWREDALKRFKKELKSDPNVSKAAMIRHIRLELEPPCTDPTIDEWLGFSLSGPPPICRKQITTCFAMATRPQFA